MTPWINLLLVVIMIGPIFASGSPEEPIVLQSIKIWRNSRKIELQGFVNMREGLIELFATTRGGKLHESLLVLDCTPELLHASLILIGLRNGGGGKYQGDPGPIFGDALYIYIKWKEDRQEKCYRAEDVIWDQKSERPMTRTSWIFTGSRFLKNSSGGFVFGANVNGVLIATYYDPDAILNNPLPERTDDTIYHANSDKLPQQKTPVVIILTPYPLE